MMSQWLPGTYQALSLKSLTDKEQESLISEQKETHTQHSQNRSTVIPLRQYNPDRHIYQREKIVNIKRLLGGKSIKTQLETSLQEKQRLERLTHPSCTLRTASRFSRCTNSLLPIKKKKLYILLWQFLHQRSFAFSVNLQKK